MNATNDISVQLVHLEGSQKGKIQELSCPTILFGRHPDCQVQFPKDAVTLSRRHAQIIREGSRFKMIDQSTNGTFVNGQKVSEAYLQEGDVIAFTASGPKISFLIRRNGQPAPSARTPLPKPAGPSALLADGPPQSAPGQQNAAIPFVIQYGPILKSFRSLPITLGKGEHCDFVINHASLYDQQARIFVIQNQFWIKDLTGAKAVMINNAAIKNGQAALESNMQLSLSPQGPNFRFLGRGQLVEFEGSLPEASQAPSSQAAPEVSKHPGKFSAMAQRVEGLFKKFFKQHPSEKEF